MDVPVDDQDLLQLVSIEKDLRRDGERVEVTEAPGGRVVHQLFRGTRNTSESSRQGSY